MVQHAALAEFEFQELRTDLVRFERLVDHVHDVAVEELAQRQVDRNPHRTITGVGPRTDLAHCLADDRVPDAYHQAGTFRHRHKIRR